MPARVPVPFPLSKKLTPAGSATPPRVSEGVGNPVAVTVNDPATPTSKVAAFPLVMAGAWFTVRVKACAGVVPTTFWAVKVMA